jgi:hypothetical protein
MGRSTFRFEGNLIQGNTVIGDKNNQTVVQGEPVPEPSVRKEKVKILFLAANPVDTDRIQSDQEAREIGRALRDAGAADRFELLLNGAVQIDDLQRLIFASNPDIVHFSAHGSTDSEIVVEGAWGRSRAVGGEALAELFRCLRGRIRCVVLNACHSAKQAEEIARHVECALGMSGVIGGFSARQFSFSFYRALALGASVQQAFDLALNQIELNGIALRAEPKLFGNPGGVTFQS